MRDRRRARWQVAAVLAGCLTSTVTLTACASTISGHGSTAAAGAAGTGSSVPSGFPSSFPSLGSSGGGTGGPAGAGVPFSYPQGHFRATFPAQPTTDTTPGTVSGASYILYVAQAEAGGDPTLLACEDISVSLPADQFDETLRGAVGGFEGSSGLTLKDQNSTTFRGHAARLAHFESPHGGTFTLLATMFTARRLYLFFGSTGSVYDTLTTSFQPI